MIDEGAIEAFMSNRLRSEYERTLNHPDLRARFPHVTEEYIAARLQRLDEKAIRLVNPPQYVHFERDPNDEPILNLAIHVGRTTSFPPTVIFSTLDEAPTFNDYIPPSRWCRRARCVRNWRTNRTVETVTAEP